MPAQAARRDFRNLWLLLAATILSIVLLEAALQLVFLWRSGSWLVAGTAFQVGYTTPVPDRRGYSLRPNVDIRQGNVRLTTNADGFRNPAPADRGRPVVVVIGDSVPFGAGVDDAQTYPALLAGILKERGFDVQVLNAAVPSYNLRQSFDRLALEVFPRFSSVELIVVEAANDVSLAAQYGDAWTEDTTWARKIRDNYLGWSALAYYIGNLAIGVRQMQDAVEGRKMLGSVAANVRTQIHRYKQRGIPLIVVSVDPFYYQISNLERNRELVLYQRYAHYIPLWGALTRQFNDQLADQISWESTAYFLDTRQTMDAAGREDKYLDYIHLTPRGSQFVAEQIADLIQKKRLLEATRKLQP